MSSNQPEPLSKTTELAATALAMAYLARIEAVTLREYLLETGTIVNEDRYKELFRGQIEKVLKEHADDDWLGSQLQKAYDLIESEANPPDSISMEPGHS